MSGKEYLVYGGDTVCLEIRTRNDAIIVVDAGTGLRRLGNFLMEEGRYSYDFLFTHAHWDHLMGFPFFKPLYLEDVRIRMHGCPFTQQYVRRLVSRIMAPPNFPVDPSAIRAQMEYGDECPLSFAIDSVTIEPIPLSHPNRGSGYRFIEDGKVFVFLTDNELDHLHPGGLPFEAYRDFSAGADLLIHDAEYTPEEYVRTKGWGHSVYTRTVELALEAGARKLGLYHLNQDRSDQQMDLVVADSSKIVKNKGGRLECFAVAQDMTFTL